MYFDQIVPCRSSARRTVVAAAGIVAFIFAAAVPAAAQTAEEMEALKSEIQSLKKGQAAIQRELATIRQLLEKGTHVVGRPQRQAFQPTSLSISRAPFLGNEDAKVVLVEFTDYQCPFCRRHFAATRPLLVKNYVETGKIKYVVREFPIESIHPQAFGAALAALCAGDQGKYWEIAGLFFANQKQLHPERLMAHAERAALDVTRFSECFETEKYAERVRRDIKEGIAAGITGTPTTFLGITDLEDPTKITATKMLPGAQSYAAFQRAVDQLIAEVEKDS